MWENCPGLIKFKGLRDIVKKIKKRNGSVVFVLMPVDNNILIVNL